MNVIKKGWITLARSFPNVFTNQQKISYYEHYMINDAIATAAGICTDILDCSVWKYFRFR